MCIHVIRLMIDSEEMNIFWESWNSPLKTKRKKNSKKDRKGKNKEIAKTNDSTQNKKKKKSSKVKDTKKEKRKGKKKSALGLDQDGNTCQTVVKVKPYTTDNPETQNTKKKTKKVAFDLLPGHDHGKHSKYVFCSLQTPEESTAVTGAVGVGANRPQVTDQNQSLSVHDDSQCPSDDVQSQDLFITQRTFRSPVSQTSSSGSSDKAGFVTHAYLDKHTPVLKIASQDPEFYQRKVAQKKNTLEVLFSQEDDDDKMDRVFFQKQKESNTKHTKYKSASRHLSIKPKPVNPYLDAPTVVDDDAASTKASTVSSAFTQTENFFTTELSSYLSFCQRNTRSAHSEDARPLDLSLPHRVRKHHKTSVTETQDHQDGRCNGGDGRQEPELKDAEGGGASHSGRLRSVGGQGKDQKTPSPQSESESKSADTTGSSEDGEAPCRHSRLDVMQFQVRAVQMRLNESFFFKAKGERHSPRPASPLMKLSQGRDVKSKKRH